MCELLLPHTSCAALLTPIMAPPLVLLLPLLLLLLEKHGWCRRGHTTWAGPFKGYCAYRV